jgi:hypothetical protein
MVVLPVPATPITTTTWGVFIAASLSAVFIDTWTPSDVDATETH